jgi:hypothetical protein
MSFFDQIPPPVPEEPALRQPVWSAPPENVIGATVPFDLVVANTGDVAVAVGGMTAYPTGSRAVADHGPNEPSSGPTLVGRGGSGGGLSYELGYWLWPLPPAGPVRFACEWPDEGIKETTAALDAPIRDAAARAIELWPDERPVGDEW